MAVLPPESHLRVGWVSAFERSAHPLRQLLLKHRIQFGWKKICV
ncbi:MAG: hypothetical protein ABSC37_06700 [Xanthobacteraceae bacterium]